MVKIRNLRKKIKTLSTKLSTINSSWSSVSLKKQGRMSGKMTEKKGQKEKTAERINVEVLEPMASAAQQPVKKKLKPYTKSNMDRHYGNVGTSNKPFEFSPHKLVEIYHNNAAKESDSEEEKNRSKIHVGEENLTIFPKN